MGPGRKQRKHSFLQFEIKALRELLEKLSWMGLMWLLIEILLAIHDCDVL